MDSQEKLEILAEAGRHDLACACGTGSPEERRRRDAAGQAWLYPVSLPNGGSGIVLKTLLSSACVGDCGYCPLRADADLVRRCTLGADELARLFLEYNRRRRLLGLFVSSGIIRDPDHTMARLNTVAILLRRKYGYRGYLHLKVIPGASDEAVAEAAGLASALSLNIETPSAGHCAGLSGRKDWERDILRTIRKIRELADNLPGRRRLRQTSQFIVGAAAETDREILDRTGELYRECRLERVYFSAYQRGTGRPGIPGEAKPDPGILSREHRLYQADFLLRKYGFEPAELPCEADGRLSPAADPKRRWADRHPEFFPLRLRTAERWQLLRVPGLGPVTVDRLLAARRETSLRNLGGLRIGPGRSALAAGYLDFS
ncbi:MAG: radical SAM protein [Planctomycetota bacterium]|jgi:predicted DNA-binding helix-hairpin-helix protein|nr:radical SAM protein [Planctomycetota bacterium]